MAANGVGGAGPPPARGGGLLVPDLWTMEELCQPSLDGQGGPISPIAIQATTFGLKNDMIQQVQNSCPFRGPGDDTNKHLDKFFACPPQVMKENGAPDDDPSCYISSFTPCKDRNADAAGGPICKGSLEDCYELLENIPPHQNDWDTSAQRKSQSEFYHSSKPKIASLKLQMEEMIVT
ncbi:hypothetical protein Tco_0786299 [Tanacetum coccineum]